MYETGIGPKLINGLIPRFFKLILNLHSLVRYAGVLLCFSILLHSFDVVLRLLLSMPMEIRALSILNAAMH